MQVYDAVIFFSLWNTGLTDETLEILASFIPMCINLRYVTDSLITVVILSNCQLIYLVNMEQFVLSQILLIAYNIKIN